MQHEKATLVAVLDAVEAWHHRAHLSGGAFAACPLEPCGEVVHALATAGDRPHLRLVRDAVSEEAADPLLPRRAVPTENPTR